MGAEEVGGLMVMVLLVGLFALGFSKLCFFKAFAEKTFIPGT